MVSGAPGTKTTQLFSPGTPRNQTDQIFDPALLTQVQDGPDGKTAIYNFVMAVTTAPAPNPVPVASTGHLFAETGFTVAGSFWTAWQGGRAFAASLAINGLPITAARDEVSPTDGKMYLTQWFERARVEYHPENQPPYQTLFGLLGTAAAQGRQNEAPFRPVADPGGALRFFPATRHTLGDAGAGGQAIAAFWTRAGGLAQFGFPIAQPFSEVSKDDGQSYLVQYFERQRLEYHPANLGTAYTVLLGRLGAEQVTR